MVGRRKRFAFADSAQQLVGGFLLAGPFVVTEEVWVLGANLPWLNTVVTALLVVGIGYGALYKADNRRDPEREMDVAGVPVRFLSLMVVSFGSVAVLAFAFSAPSTFGATMETTVKVITLVAVFSVVGAATADTVF